MKKIIITLILVALGAFAWWVIEPLLGDDVVNEEIAIKIPIQDNNISDRAVVEEVEEKLVVSEKELEIEKEPEIKVEIELEKEVEEPVVIEQQEERIYSGTFKDADPSHRASGKAYAQGNTLSLVDLNSTNVPDGYLYLATDDRASDFVSLGKLKGNVGNQNYSIPEGTDLEKYDHVLVWCRAFSILVGTAVLK